MIDFILWGIAGVGLIFIVMVLVAPVPPRGGTEVHQGRTFEDFGVVKDVYEVRLCPSCGTKHNFIENWRELASEGIGDEEFGECYACHVISPHEKWLSEDEWKIASRGEPLITISDEELEKLAEIQHKIWSLWVGKMVDRCVVRTYHGGEGRLISIGNDDADKWKIMSNTPYSELSDDEKQENRDRVLEFAEVMK